MNANIVSIIRTIGCTYFSDSMAQTIILNDCFRLILAARFDDSNVPFGAFAAVESELVK